MTQNSQRYFKNRGAFTTRCYALKLYDFTAIAQSQLTLVFSKSTIETLEKGVQS